MDYTELAKAVRDMSWKYGIYGTEQATILQEAADAVEELVELVGRYKDVCDKMAANIDKLRDLCKALYYHNKAIPEPPKEGQT